MSLLAELSKKRKPAQEELVVEELTIDGSTPVEYGEPVSMPDLKVDVNPNPNLPKDEIGRDLRSALVDAFVGGAPGLLSTLGGASPYVQNMQYDRGNEYAKKRSQDELNAKLVQLKSTDGTPYYEKARYAVGMEPYIAVKKGQGRNYGIGGLKEFEKIGNPDETVFAGLDQDTGGFVDFRTGEKLDLAKYQPKQTTKNYTYKDPMGNIVNAPISRGGTLREKTTIDKGEGADINIPLTKIRDADKKAADYVKRTSKYEDDLGLLAYGENVLSDPNSSPQEKKLAIGQIIKSVESRMTDADRSEYKGEASIFTRVGDMLDMAATNELPPETVKAFLKASQDFKNKIQNTAGKYRTSVIKSYAGGNKDFQSYIEERLQPVSGGKIPYRKSEKRTGPVIGKKEGIKSLSERITGKSPNRRDQLLEVAKKRGLVK